MNSTNNTSKISDDPIAVLPPTRILRLSNMATEEDLVDDEMYEDLKLDVHEECSKSGQIISLEIPRSVNYGGNAASASAVGQIFVYFSTLEGAE
jgi:splicing factor U2AF subunit